MARLAVALVWLYQGLWCKVLLACPAHLEILRAIPFLDQREARIGLRALGILETGLALWILAGWRPYAAAWTQTLLLVTMNGGGLVWSPESIESPGAMVTQNLAFLVLAWIAAGRAAEGSSGSGFFRHGGSSAAGDPPQVLFGWSYEDPAIEASVFPAGGRVFCIAAAGDTARALAARGDRVTAVDLNPAQLAYARSRAGGLPAQPGVVERRLAAGRRCVRWLGLGPRELESFLDLDDPSEQARVWRDRIVTRRLRVFLRTLLHPAALRLRFPRELVDALPPRFDRLLLARFERTFARHPNRTNRWARRLLLGRDLSEDGRGPSPATQGTLELVEGDAETCLASCAPATFDGISLSNLPDASPRSAAGLLTAARRAAKPGARIVVRGFGEPRDASAAAWAARDRSLLWGSIEVLEVRPDGRCRALAP